MASSGAAKARLLVLLLILGLVGGVLYYDSQVLLPQADGVINEAINIMPGSTKEEVHAKLERKPTATRTVTDSDSNKSYDVETYRFRLLPFSFLPGPVLEAVYDTTDDKLLRMYNEEFTTEKLKLKIEHHEGVSLSPALGGGGARPPANDDGDSDESSDDSEESSEEDQKEKDSDDGNADSEPEDTEKENQEDGN